jgi:predicted ATP-grasp superfamily ATP-dependent carboligase
VKILVLDGNENHAVACVRSLAAAGHEVYVGADTSWSKAGWSRYCKSSFVYPAPKDDIEAFVRKIAEQARRFPGTLVLPMTERTTLPLSTFREVIFAAGGKMVLPEHEIVLRAFDKQQTTKIAQNLAIETPQTFVIKDFNQATAASEQISYPAVLKPCSSEEVSVDGKVLSTGRPIYARNKSEFRDGFAEISRRCSAVLAQEFIDGNGAGYFALMREGELRVEFGHRRIRDVHPTGSGSALRESAFPAKDIRKAALAILKELQWQGVAMVEFRIRPDGRPVFLEVNGRFWNSLPLAVYAGADFPKLLAEMAEFGDVKSPYAYKAGVRCRWLLGDFRHLLEVLKGAPFAYPGKFPGRFETITKFFTPVPGTLHDNFTYRDPMPEFGDWLNFIFRKLPTVIKRSAGETTEANVEKRYSHS